MLAWVYLVIAGVLEVAMTTFLTKCENFTKLGWTVAFGIAAIGSFAFLAKATQTIPMGIGYAAWTGIGAAGTVLVQMIFFKEPVDALKIGLLVGLVGCITGLNLLHK